MFCKTYDNRRNVYAIRGISIERQICEAFVAGIGSGGGSAAAAALAVSAAFASIAFTVAIAITASVARLLAYTVSLPKNTNFCCWPNLSLEIHNSSSYPFTE